METKRKDGKRQNTSGAPPVLPDAKRAKQVPLNSTQSAQPATESAQDEEAEIEMWFGSCRSKVVGIQHYGGVVTNGENVLLVREPSNKYDPNAVQVLNMDRTQVGHINRQDALQIARLMDALKDGLRVEGTIPTGSGNTYKMPVDVSFFGRLQDMPRVHATIKNMEKAVQNTQMNVPPPVKGRKKQQSGPNPSTIIERELDRLYASEVSYENAPAQPGPANLAATLYEHQQKALAWMLDREKEVDIAKLLRQSTAKNPSAFFWTLKDGMFLNQATNYASKTPPKLAKGGILADDMGLGKTVTALALILSQRESLPGPTLIVAPVSVLGSWADHIQALCPDDFSCCLHHGPNRSRDAATMSSDVVLTTFGTLAADFKDVGSTKGLHGVKWARVVLDEAHQIKNNRSLQCRSCCALDSQVRWCLTGTPIQNKLDDLFSLVKFLRLEPLCEKDWWTRLVMTPLKYCNPVGFERLQIILKTFCLRRTKSMQIRVNGITQALLELPPITQTVLRVKLSSSDQQSYDQMFSQARGAFENLCEQNQVMSKYAIILTVLLRLRQLSCHRELVTDIQLEEDVFESERNEELVQRVLAMLSAETFNDDCAICLEPLSPALCAITPCAHVFCRDCAENTLRVNPCCPLCRQPVEIRHLIDPPGPSEPEEEQVKHSTSGNTSAKISALLESLGDDQGKALVFSQFTSFMDLIGTQLDLHGVKFVRLDGKKSLMQRQSAVSAFQNDPSVRVFLISLKAGGTGLNLTAASRVFLMDPWWNPSAEDQAVDRCHRIGQVQPVHVTRIVAANTIEEKILELQEKKRGIAKCAFGSAPKTSQEVEKLNDLRLMFGA